MSDFTVDFGRKHYLNYKKAAEIQSFITY